MTQTLPSPEFLRKVLRYEEETGKLYWRERTPETFAKSNQCEVAKCKAWNARWAGKEACTERHCDGYLRGKINRQKIMAHRIIWAMAYNSWPKDQIDHIDRNRTNNVLSNLRQATNEQNSYNKTISKHNTSGLKGVSWSSKYNQWVAQIMVKGKTRHIGRYDDIFDAHAAYVRMSKIHFGQYACRG